MNFGRRLERSETINERNDDKKSSNSKNSWQNEIKLDDDIGEWKNEIKLDDDMKLPSKDSYADILESLMIAEEFFREVRETRSPERFNDKKSIKDSPLGKAAAKINVTDKDIKDLDKPIAYSINNKSNESFEDSEEIEDVLESLFIEPALEAVTEVPKSVKFKFYGKEWEVPVSIRAKIDDKDAIAMIQKFQRSAESISKRIEKKFCDICNKYNDDPSYTKIPAGSIKSYSDVKGLDIRKIRISEPWEHNYKPALFVVGEYQIDDEHGYSLAFINGSWDGQIRQASDSL